jgi:hypothetical protein
MHTTIINIRPAICGRMQYQQALRFHRPDYRVEPLVPGRRCFVAIQQRGVVQARLFEHGAFRQVPGTKPAPWHHELSGCLFDGVLADDRQLVLFDLLCLRGRDIRNLPLHQRRAALNSVADFLPEGVRIIQQEEHAGPLCGRPMVWKCAEAAYADQLWFKASPTE